VLEEALRAAKLPYQIIGGLKFYDRAEIKDAIAYLRILVNPASDVDLLRVINVPARGIGQTTVDRLTAWATAAGVPLFDALARIDEVADLGAAARKKLAAFRVLLDKLRAAALPPSELLEQLLTETGYIGALEKEDTAEADARGENLRELVGSMNDYEAESEAAGEPPSLAGFLERVTLVSDVDGMKDASRVVLMTVHGAKGLEFDRVLLTGMEEEMFPYKGVEPGEKDELEEERRLAYVAITRARKQLVMTHTQMRQIFGTTRWNRPSRFLGELPPGVAEHHATGALGAGSGEGRFGSRFVDRNDWSSAGMQAQRRRPGAGEHGAAREAGDEEGGGPPWRHPQARTPATSADASGRYVDHDFFDDRSPDVTDVPLRRGARVRHDRFGEGQVVRMVSVGEPAVVAFFPGWGEKKILARFLKPA
jgi:DNA helicase-2/ATP-dependent DNA helicase PcrA